MDRWGKFCLPPRRTELDSDLDRGSILELTDGTPLAVITVNVDPSEVHEAETRQRNGRNDSGIRLRALSPVDRNVHAVVLGVLRNCGDRALELRCVLHIL